MPRAEDDLDAIFAFIGAGTSAAANRWFRGMIEAIEGLAEHPQRHPATPEDPELRHLLYGNKPHIYRLIYSIDVAASRVNIVHVRHRAQQPFNFESEDR